MEISLGQARRFVLLQQGLLGGYRYAGKQGALDFVRHAGCIQFDPVDVCGKMAELTLQSRVKGFSKQQLNELLYEDRRLFDYPDKQLSILPTENWPYYSRYREQARRGGEKFEGMDLLEAQALAYIREKGPVCSEELPLSGKLFWHSHIHWSGDWHGESKASRAVLEQLYSTGELVIHHKRGTRKYYDLAQRHIPAQILQAPEPLPDDFDHQKWRVQNRIGAAGLVWDRASGYWNNVWGLTTDLRHKVIQTLLQEGAIASLRIQGLKPDFYYRVQDAPLLELACSGRSHRRRCELIAPLDPFLWDKPLTRALFGFAYTWEIYTPQEKRRYGAYTLPILYGERFAGRLEAVCDRETKTLRVRNIWYEDGVRQTKALAEALEACLKRFAAFNGCTDLSMDRTA